MLLEMLPELKTNTRCRDSTESVSVQPKSSTGLDSTID